MNQTSETTFSEAVNPWKQRSSLPKPASGSVTMAAVMFAVASAAIPFSLIHETVAIVVWGLLIAGGFFFTRQSRALTGLMIAASLLGAILPGVILPVNTLYYPAIGAIVAAMCVGVCTGTYFQTVTDRFWVLPILSALGAVAAYFVTEQWLIAVMGLALLPAVMALSVATRMGEGCTSAICYCIGGFLISAVALIGLWIWTACGSLNAGLLRELLAEWKESFVQSQIAARGELIALIDERMASGEEMTEELAANYEALKSSFLSLMSDNVIRRSMDALFNMLPAVLFLACSIPAYLGQRLLNSSYVTNGMSAVVTPESEFFTMSLPSAVLYAVSLFVSVLAIDGIGFVSMVADNLCLILLPGMLLLGMRYFKQQFGVGRAGSRRWITVLLIVMLCCATSGMLYLGAFFGAYMRIMQAIRKAIQKKMNQNR